LVTFGVLPASTCVMAEDLTTKGHAIYHDQDSLVAHTRYLLNSVSEILQQDLDLDPYLGIDWP
ncbi:hypothetical protein BGZ93_005540, partial [Podila epicladia]